MLVFIINSIIQEQYHSLQIENPDTGEIQQYYGSAIGDIVSEMTGIYHYSILNGEGKNIYLMVASFLTESMKMIMLFGESIILTANSIVMKSN